MSLLEDRSYKEQIEKSYVLTLQDLLTGVSYNDLIDDIKEFERKEMYEVCEGIKLALERAKNKISDKISQCARKIQAKEIPLNDLAFNVMLSKAPAEYTKTIPQHIRAAKQLESIREIKKGDIISYVKILNKPGVKPIEIAKTSEIDSSKYMEFMESTLDQLTSSMDLDFDVMLGKPKQTGLEQFFWN